MQKLHTVTLYGILQRQLHIRPIVWFQPVGQLHAESLEPQMIILEHYLKHDRVAAARFGLTNLEKNRKKVFYLTRVFNFNFNFIFKLFCSYCEFRVFKWHPLSWTKCEKCQQLLSQPFSECCWYLVLYYRSPGFSRFV